MIKISNLSKSFTDKMVLKNLNLEIKDGEVFGLVGINGAGKSTLLRLMSGIYKADNGSILIDGEEVYENEKIKNQIFFLPDEPYYASNTTPLSLIGLYETFYDFDKEVYLKHLKKFALPLKKSLHNFSKGMKRQVFISLAIAIKPKYLFLDEAFDGLDPLARLEFKRALIELVSENNMTVIISSHSLRELEDICDSYGILDHGKITSSGELESELTSLHKFQAAFEGEISKENLGFECMSFRKTGRVVQLIARGEVEDIKQKLAEKQPLFIEEIEVDFEELFIAEVEARGYLQ